MHELSPNYGLRDLLRDENHELKVPLLAVEQTEELEVAFARTRVPLTTGLLPPENCAKFALCNGPEILIQYERSFPLGKRQ